eukprot:gene26955-35656_t
MALSALTTSQHPDKQLLVDIKKQFEKSLQLISTDGLLSLKESLSDCLSAMSSIQITPDLIKELKLGNIVSSLKDKLETVAVDKSAEEAVRATAESLSSSCKTILLSWKRIIEATKQQQKARSSIGSKDSKSSVIPAAVSVVGGDEKANQPTIPAAKISDRAGKIELQIHSKFPNERDYVAKAKSLSFNLKKNEQALRKSVLNGSVTAAMLVSMSSTQLATHELLEKREKISEDNAESRRTDWLEENKRSIQTTIGIDPNNAWVYDDDDDRMSEPDTDPPDV